VVLPQLPPLRTGREGFPSSGSSRIKAPQKQSRYHDGLIPACWRVMPNFFASRRAIELTTPSLRYWRQRRWLV